MSNFQGGINSKPMRMPKSLTCYICGRGFMKSSIEIHLGKCGEKFHAESENYGMKRKLPARPESLDNILNMGSLPQRVLD